MDDALCEHCLHLYYDEEFDEWFCEAQDCMDEDDVARQLGAPDKKDRPCPFFRAGDEYTIVRHQN